MNDLPECPASSRVAPTAAEPSGAPATAIQAVRTTEADARPALAARGLRHVALGLGLGLGLGLAPWWAAGAGAQPEPPTEPAAGPTLVVRAATAAPQQPPPPSATPTWPAPTVTPAASATATRFPSFPPTWTPRPSTTPSAEPTDTPAPYDLPNEERPLIVVDGFDAAPGRPSPGDRFRLTLHVKNEGEHFAENVQLTLSSATFLPVDRGAVLYANTIDEGDTRSLSVDLRVTSDAKAGVYPIAIALRWDDSYGGKYSDEASIGIEVGGASATRPLLAVVASRLPGRVAPDVPFTIALDVVNTGGKEARNVTVAPTGGPLTVQAAGGGPLVIPPGGQATVSLRATAAGSDTPGAASQALELRYDDPDGTRYTEGHVLGVVVTGEAAYDPLPMVTGYRVRTAATRGAPDGLLTLQPGEVFTLEIDVLNAGPTDAVGTRLALGGGGAPAAAGSASGTSLGVFAPVGTSNLRFLDRLAAGESRTVEQRLVIDGTAKPGVYVLELAFNYLDANGQALSSSEVVSLLVDRKVTLDLNPISVVTDTLVGRPVPLVLDLVNLGNSTVSVGNARIEGRGLTITRGAKQFVGPLDASGFFTLDAEVLPDTPGIAWASVIVEYFDSFNQLQTFEQRIDFNVADAPELPEVEVEPAAPPDSLPWRIVKGFLGLGTPRPAATAVPLPVDGAPAGAIDAPPP